MHSQQSPVAVIIPVRGRPRLLERALQSVLDQSVAPAEVLVIVDETPRGGAADADSATGFADSFAARGAGFTVLHSDGRGPAAARNLGARAARTKWLALLDSDDTWSPEKLALQLAYREKRPQLHGCQTLESWFRDGVELQQPQRLRPRPGRFLRDSFFTCLVACSAVMIRRDTLLGLGGFDESYVVCEDFELWLRYLEQYPMGLVPLALTQKHAGGWPQQSQSQTMLDAVRIRAILSAVDRKTISAEERVAAHAACSQKLEILGRGAARHGSADRIRALEIEVGERFARQET